MILYGSNSIPYLRTNLLSISKLLKHGHKVQFHNQNVKIITECGEAISKAYKYNDVFIVDIEVQERL